MSDIEKAIRIYDIPENKKITFDNNVTFIDKIVAYQVEQMDDFICESIIKCLPEDVTRVIVLDKNKIAEIFRKHVPIEPDRYYCPICHQYHDDWGDSWKHCPNCGQRISR